MLCRQPQAPCGRNGGPVSHAAAGCCMHMPPGRGLNCYRCVCLCEQTNRRLRAARLRASGGLRAK